MLNCFLAKFYEQDHFRGQFKFFKKTTLETKTLDDDNLDLATKKNC